MHVAIEAAEEAARSHADENAYTIPASVAWDNLMAKWALKGDPRLNKIQGFECPPEFADHYRFCMHAQMA